MKMIEQKIVELEVIQDEIVFISSNLLVLRAVLEDLRGEVPKETFIEALDANRSHLDRIGEQFIRMNEELCDINRRLVVVPGEESKTA